jgi:hypothetical protein
MRLLVRLQLVKSRFGGFLSATTTKTGSKVYSFAKLPAISVYTLETLRSGPLDENALIFRCLIASTRNNIGIEQNAVIPSLRYCCIVVETYR